MKTVPFQVVALGVGLALLASGAAAMTPEARCRTERGRIEAKHVSCRKSCEARFKRSLSRGPIDLTACEDECRATYERLLADFETNASCAPEEIEEIDFGGAPSAGTVRGIVQTPGGPIEADLEVVDGKAVFEGDIVVGDADEVERTATNDGLGQVRSTARSFVAYRWPNGVIPFTIAPNVPTTTRQWITDAIRHWEANTPIRFVNRQQETSYVTFNRPSSDDVCQSDVGRTGAQQLIDIGNKCGFGATVHEIGHAVGLWHEQSRADRDANVIVNWSNIKDGKKSQFKTYSERGEDGMDIDFFDFDSIMLYPSIITDKNFVKDTTKPAMTRRDGTTYTAQRNGLSRQDIAAVRFLYRKQAGSIVGLGDKCLQVADGVFANRVPIQINDCRPASPFYDPFSWAQRWSVTGGTVRSVFASSKVIDMPYWTNGSGVWIFDYWGGPNQRFDVSGAEIRTTGGNCVSAVPGVWQAEVMGCKAGWGEIVSNNIATRKWTYTPSGEIRTASGLCLDVRYWDTRNGTPVVAHPCNGGANQKWSLGPNGQIRGYGGKCLDVREWLDQPGTGLQIWDCQGGTNQAFTLRGEIREPGGKCLDIPWNTANGTPATVWDCHGGTNQKFELFP